MITKIETQTITTINGISTVSNDNTYSIDVGLQEYEIKSDSRNATEICKFKEVSIIKDDPTKFWSITKDGKRLTKHAISGVLIDRFDNKVIISILQDIVTYNDTQMDGSHTVKYNIIRQYTYKLVEFDLMHKTIDVTDLPVIKDIELKQKSLKKATKISDTKTIKNNKARHNNIIGSLEL